MKMSQLGFFVDVSKCSGCKTCAVACKDAHNLPVGLNFRKVREYAGGNWKKDANGAWEQDVFAYYVSTACNQCTDPACVKVCPTKAHQKRAADGLVLIETAKCIGCGMCAQACPYHAPVLDVDAKKMRKCDACVDRLQTGRQPICVESCPNRAIEFGDIEVLRKKYGALADVAPLPSSAATKPNLVLLVPKQAKPAGDTTGVEY